jgi:hypothetical protein
MYSLKLLQVSLLESSQKGVIEKMVDLIQFWFIQESELVQNSPCSIFNIMILKFSTQETTAHTLSNAIGLTSFGFSMNKL